MLNIPVDTLIFDLDNTLIDRNEAMRLVFRDWLQLQGYHARQSKTILDEIMLQDDWGYSDRNRLCNWLLHTYGNDESRKLSPQRLLKFFHENIVNYIQPGQIVNDTLCTLSTSFRLVLASNGNSATQRTKLIRAQLDSFFQPHTVFISGETGVSKPDPLFFKRIIDDLQLNSRRAMVIGDHPVNDIQAATACGLLTCWVSHNRQPADGFMPDRVITNITETGRWIKQ